MARTNASWGSRAAFGPCRHATRSAQSSLRFRRKATEASQRAKGSSFTEGRLPIEQQALAFHAPGVAGQRAVIPHNPMAGDRHREIVCGTGAGDGPNRLGRADPAGDLSVGNGVTDRDLLERLPNPLLERGATHIERQIETEIRRLDKADDARHQGFVVAV